MTNETNLVKIVMLEFKKKILSKPFKTYLNLTIF